MQSRSMLIVLLLLCGVCSFAADKPDFSGAWVLDKDRSFSTQPGLEQTMTITHAGDSLKLVGKQKSLRGEVDLNESYALDGKQGDFTPLNPPNAKGKRKAYWLPNDKGLIVEDEIVSDSPNGPTTQLITRKWRLSPDGSVLTIDYFIDNARGSFESKRVFVKKKS